MISKILIITFSIFLNQNINKDYKYIDTMVNENIVIFKENYDEYQKYLKENYYKGESKEQIAKKLNKYLNSTLKNKGKYIVDYSLKVNIDPYLVTAVMLQETGCRWTCSYLTRVCNNVGGNKGKPGCNGGSYRKFDSINEGITFAVDKLNSYYKKGYKTPEEINPFYASDKTWYKKINNYINLLKKG